MVTRVLRPEEVPFDPAVAYRFLKIRNDSDKFAQMSELVLRLYREHRQEIAPRYRYRISRVDHVTQDPPEVRFDGGIRFRGKGVANLLSRSDYGVLFLLTLGEEIDRTLAQWSREDPAGAYFLDGVASALTEGVLAMLKEDALDRCVAMGYDLGGRYAPGYAHWAIEEQQQLVAVLQGHEIGVHVSDTSFLIPQKSLTGVFSVRRFLSRPKEF